MAKRSFDPRVAYPEVKVQVRDLVRVVGIVASFVPRSSVFGENSFYRAPRVNGPGTPSGSTPRECQVQRQDRVGIVERSCGYRARGVSVRGKCVLSRKPGYKTKGSLCG